MHTKGAVTGQQEQELPIDNTEVFPSGDKGLEFLRRLQDETVRPHEVLGDGRPKWNGEVFFERREGAESGVTYLLDGENLEYKVAECTGAHVHLETTAAGGFSFMVDGHNAPRSTVSGISTHPHLNKRRNPMTPPKCMPEVTMEKRRVIPVCLIENDSGLERKQSQ
jgi:hypothetical protein